MKANKNFWIIALIAIVNALGYGIIIPVLYSYSKEFGMSDFDNGLLFATFSIFQFFATPVIGRLSDRFGRKPLLVISIAGTALSFVIMALARNGSWLFFARALDGVTAGNISVALAVISDMTKPHERAKGFGLIGASFGFGFVFGPAISAAMVGMGLAAPFVLAAVIAGLATILTVVFLKETNTHMGQVSHGPLFNFPKLIHALFDKNVGTTLIVSLLFSFAISMFIYAYQPFSVQIMGFSPRQISLNFTLFGLVSLITQGLLIPRLVPKIGDRQSLRGSLGLAVATFLGFFLVRSQIGFLVVSAFHAAANGIVNPMIQTLLSKETDAASQGSVMGINASIISVGMIVGPIVGGFLATLFTPLPFLAGSVVTLICFVLSFQIFRKAHVVKVGI
jgi:multidrug resistance protein